MKQVISFFLISVSLSAFAQDFDDEDDFLDSNYLEDQFYAGIVYNLLLNEPQSVIQRNLSYGIHAGFIKDIPLNQKRNFGVALGIGYATNSYYSNILAESTDDGIAYSIPEVTLDRSKFETHAIEFPFEIRWRTSNAIDYRFWRIYAGAKITYNFSRISKFVDDEEGSVSFTNEDIRPLEYGLMLNIGYNTFNIHLYYGLNPILENSARLNTEAIKMRAFRLGLIFYIL